MSVVTYTVHSLEELAQFLEHKGDAVALIAPKHAKAQAIAKAEADAWRAAASVVRNTKIEPGEGSQNEPVA